MHKRNFALEELERMSREELEKLPKEVKEEFYRRMTLDNLPLSDENVVVDAQSGAVDVSPRAQAMEDHAEEFLARQEDFQYERRSLQRAEKKHPKALRLKKRGF